MNSLVVVTPPATEPLSVTEVMTHCKLDASNLEPTPGAITVALLSPVAAGNVEAGVHRYACTFQTTDGETNAGTISDAITVADKAINGKVSLTNIPIGGDLVTSRKLYRTEAGGSTLLLLATLADNTTTVYVDNIADASLGAEAPSTNTTGDPQIALWIAAARTFAETELKRYLITQAIEARFDNFPRNRPEHYLWHSGPTGHIQDEYQCRRSSADILLPPLQSITSVSYIDDNGEAQTLPTDQYLVDSKSVPSRVSPAYNCSWPSTRRQNNAVTIRFIAGYGTASAVPRCIKQWMLIQIETWRTNAGAVVLGERGAAQQVPSEFVDGLLNNERVYSTLFT